MIHDYTSHFISVLSQLSYISLKTMGMIKNIRRDNAYNSVDDDGEGGITTKSLQLNVVFIICKLYSIYLQASVILTILYMMILKKEIVLKMMKNFMKRTMKVQIGKW